MTSSRILKTGVAILFFALMVAYVAFKSGLFSNESDTIPNVLQEETQTNDTSTIITEDSLPLKNSSANQNVSDKNEASSTSIPADKNNNVYAPSSKSSLAFSPSDVKQISSKPILNQQKSTQKTSQVKKVDTEYDAKWHAYSSKSAPAFTSDDIYYNRIRANEANENPPVLTQQQSDSLQRDQARRNWISNHPDDPHWKFLTNKIPSEGSPNAHYIDSLINTSSGNPK